VSDAAGSWGRHMDELAAAATALLMRGAGAPQPLIDPHSALAARDTVLQQLRKLVAAVGDVPQFTEVRELTLADVVHRPAQALHHSLSRLPRALPFGAAELAAADLPRLPPYEQAWQRAAGATLALEVYLDVLGRLPDATAWHVLRDLTDVAAALPYLDHDLSEALLPALLPGRDLDDAYRMLTHPGHDALRIVTAELRVRAPADPNWVGASPPTRPHEQQPSRSTPALRGAPASPGASTAPSRGQHEHTVRARSAAALGEAMLRYAHAVGARGSHVSVADVKAAQRLLEVGSAHAASVLERAAPALASASDVAHALRATAQDAAALREAPAQSMTPPHLELIAASRDLVTELTGLAGQAARLPESAGPRDLRRLAAAALSYAEQVGTLATALDLSVREALADRLMLIPGTTGDSRTSTISWVTVTMGPRRDGPPAIALAAGQLATTARRLPPVVRQGAQELARHATSASTATQQAVLNARRHVGAARAELRQALTDRTSSQPLVLGAELPPHPRMSAPHPTGRQR
jgi:hypothetical protein